MATQRVSRLQKRMLRLLLAEYHCTHGGMAMGHRELVKALAGDKSHISHSLRILGPNPTSLLPGAISLAETVLRPFQ
jgi:hypothetical protein